MTKSKSVIKRRSNLRLWWFDFRYRCIDRTERYALGWAMFSALAKMPAHIELRLIEDRGLWVVEGVRRDSGEELRGEHRHLYVAIRRMCTATPEQGA